MADPTVLNETGIDAAARDYIAWVADALSLRVQADPLGNLELLPIAPASDTERPTAAAITIESTLDCAKLWDLQRQFAGGAIEAQAAGESSHVAGIATVVLKPYQIRQGRVQLAGCTLEPRPFLRISTLATEIEHHWFDRDGNVVAAELAARLELDRLVAVAPRLKASDRSTVTAWIDAAMGSLTNRQTIGVAVAWSPWVAGKVRIQFDQGEQTSLAFEGWGIEWERGGLHPPLFRCPITGIESYNIVCTDEGTITAREALGHCELSGKEALQAELERCAVTGKTVLPDLLTTCPITHERFLADLAKKCEWCQRLVSPLAIDQQRCQQCSEATATDALETVVCEFTAAHPEFKKLARWKGWASDELALLVGRRWLSETLVLVSRPGMQILRTGSRTRFSKTWQFED
ncbi:hypothetical protein Poly24_06360 [Rosistilla carotiformis]|uniref:Uncharacterized protein n=1 Tax=Rosistilla carotiformis TaxID=2528017 RepID=A0A518JN56_9BACT|nr:hypothetical protein [Rosistilla carotiformis]QDV66947.1 hypothetical protein Poly24_06360 [Rosistilla carotiformis]